MAGWGDRSRVQQAISSERNRYQSQQAPFAEAANYNYGRGSESDFGDKTDIMNRYRSLYDAAGNPSGGGGGGGGDGGGGGYTPFLVSPGRASYSDPFKSYAGFEEFSKTGGFSPTDIANMRARGIAPVRAAYANAEREVGRQRSLQGGYSPNAIATQARMAREQGQAGADAVQGVEAGLAQMRQQGRLAGLGGMSGIETSRLGADVDLSKFNVGLDYQGQTFNAGQMEQAQARNNAAAAASAGRAAAAAEANRADQFRALQGMTTAYGTTPGASNVYGNQALNAIGQGGNMGIGYIGAETQGTNVPSNWDVTANRVGQISGAVYPWLERYGPQRRTAGGGGYGPAGAPPAGGGGYG